MHALATLLDWIRYSASRLAAAIGVPPRRITAWI